MRLLEEKRSSCFALIFNSSPKVEESRITERARSADNFVAALQRSVLLEGEG